MLVAHRLNVNLVAHMLNINMHVSIYYQEDYHTQILEWRRWRGFFICFVGLLISWNPMFASGCLAPPLFCRWTRSSAPKGLPPSRYALNAITMRRREHAFIFETRGCKRSSGGSFPQIFGGERFHFFDCDSSVQSLWSQFVTHFWRWHATLIH